MQNLTIAIIVKYDLMGRLIKASVPSKDIPDAYDYNLTAYEPSPRGKAVSATKAGSAWHAGNKSVRTRTLTNTASGALACPRYSTEGDGIYTHEGNYAAGTLIVEEVTDENDHVIRKYTNKSGLEVMSEEGDGASDMLRTRRIYDSYGRLRAILPPSVDDGTIESHDDVFVLNCHEFGYDTRGRLTWSRKPGATLRSEQRYSRAGRVVVERTPSMAAGKWLTHYYDKQGRKVYSAMANLTAAQLSVLENTFSVAEYTGAPNRAGYTLTPVPAVTESVTFSANYYDDYAFMERVTDSAMPAAPTGNAAGLLTGGYDARYTDGSTAQAADAEGYYSVVQYDRWGRVVRTDRQTAMGALTVSSTLDRAGNVLASAERLTYSDGDTVSIRQTNTFDAAGRVTQWSTCHGLRSAGATVAYGKFGTVSKETFLNSVERAYEYDCHGWLTQVRTTLSPYDGIIQPLTGAGVSEEFYSGAAGTMDIIGIIPIDPDPIGPITPTTGRVHTESILYAEGEQPRYDGTASAHVSTLGGRYDYTFDCHDRLTLAQYTAGTDAEDDEDFSTAYQYNDVGAPVALTRMGVNDMEMDMSGEPTEVFGTLDDLEYSWNGALLMQVDAQPNGWDFYGRTGFAASATGYGAVFAWDEAGQMVADSSRGITDIQYNRAGQPVRVTFDNLIMVEYEYTVDGTLERQKTLRLRPNGLPYAKPERTRTYVGDFVFENDTLAMVNFQGGYFDSRGLPHYRHTDWQGNVTMVSDRAGQLVQHTGYYPYGEPWREPTGQPYLFGGKECLRDNALNEYNFTARRYH